MTILELARVQKSFTVGHRRVPVLHDLSFTVERGSFVSVFGPNGCGKSTMMAAISGVEPVDSGEITRNLTRSRVVPMIFQDYRRSLLPWASARENILFPLKLQGVPSRQRTETLCDLLATVPFAFDLGERVGNLSGGQAQLVSILRALVTDPEIVLCDEPFSALDYQARVQLQLTLMRIAEQRRLTVLFVSHDLDEALFLGDRIIFLSPRPARVVDDMQLTLPRPRKVRDQTGAAFVALKAQALKVVDQRVFT